MSKLFRKKVKRARGALQARLKHKWSWLSPKSKKKAVAVSGPPKSGIVEELEAASKTANSIASLSSKASSTGGIIRRRRRRASTGSGSTELLEMKLDKEQEDRVEDILQDEE